MMFRAGPHRCEGTDGRYLFLDEETSPRVVDFIYAVLDRSQRHPNDVAALDIDEGSVRFYAPGFEDW